MGTRACYNGEKAKDIGDVFLKIGVMALLLTLGLVTIPAQAQGILADSLVDLSGSRGETVVPKVLSVGTYGEQYAIIPGGKYLALPPQGSLVPDPRIRKTSAGTYEYIYPSGPEETYGVTDRTVANLISSFEASDGDWTVAVKTENGPEKVYGTYDQNEAKRALILVNRAREETGLSALSWDPELAVAARLRSAELSIHNAHRRPDGTQYDTVSDKIAGENILHGYETADMAVKRMMDLPSRKENILREEFVFAGIASFESDQCTYWVIAFGKGK